jgi:hypothetical protein
VSRKKEISVERQCHLDGQKPTLRDKWLAFHRLYRLARRGNPYQAMAAVDCLRTMQKDWSWIRLLEQEVGQLSRVHWPKFLRRRFLDTERRRRLHGNHPEWRERDKIVANMVREQHGMEVTPDEVAAVRRKLITVARQKAAEVGFAVPSDDEKLLKMLKPYTEEA